MELRNSGLMQQFELSCPGLGALLGRVDEHISAPTLAERVLSLPNMSKCSISSTLASTQYLRYGRKSYSKSMSLCSVKLDNVQ